MSASMDITIECIHGSDALPLGGELLPPFKLRVTLTFRSAGSQGLGHILTGSFALESKATVISSLDWETSTTIYICIYIHTYMYILYVHNNVCITHNNENVKFLVGCRTEP